MKLGNKAISAGIGMYNIKQYLPKLGTLEPKFFFFLHKSGKDFFFCSWSRKGASHRFVTFDFHRALGSDIPATFAYFAQLTLACFPAAEAQKIFRPCPGFEPGSPANLSGLLVTS